MNIHHNVSEIGAADAGQLEALRGYVNSQIVGQAGFIDRLLIALLADGHVLLEGAPGLAKTKAVNTLAAAIHCDDRRIQFTPDLLPTDLTGTDVFRPGEGTFEFVEGPLFHNLILADEINRAPAKVQSALLEAMAERQITVGQHTYKLPDLFMVLATQNPIEQEGTYPLPEAQLDRFMFNIKIDYPTLKEEERILMTTTRGEKQEPTKVLSARAILNLQKLVASVAVSEYIIKYVASLVRATRPRDESAPEFVKELVEWGAGPRAGQFLIHGGKALAAMDGRFSVAIEDIQKVAIPVLRHRVSTNFQAQAEGMTNEDVVNRLLKEIPTPEIPKFNEKNG